MWLPSRGNVRVERRGEERGCKDPRTTILRLFALRLVAAFQTKNGEMLLPTPLPSTLPRAARQTAFVARSRVHGFIYLAHKFSQRTSGIFLQLYSSSFFFCPLLPSKGEAWPNDNDICLHLFWFSAYMFPRRRVATLPLPSMTCLAVGVTQQLSVFVSLSPFLSLSICLVRSSELNSTQTKN